MVQKLVESLSSVQARSKKKHNIERLKSLGAVVFEGSTDPIDVEVWLNLLEKCFEVMDCPQERRVKLATFLLQNKVEGWSKSIKVRRRDTNTMNWKTFTKVFEHKYYPSTFYEAKRDEF